MYIEEEKVPAAVRTYLLHLPSARVPTDVHGHLLRVLLSPQLNV